MDEINSWLHAAVADAPPTRIDVDQLIADDRQRRRHRAWAAGAGAAVVGITVTSALVAGPVPDVLTLPGEGSPSTGPSLCAVPTPSRPQPPFLTYDTVRARPTERPDEGVARLTSVLRRALADHLPAGLTVTNRNPACDLVQFRYSPSMWLYDTSPVLRRGDQVEDLSVTLMPTEAGRPQGCAAAMAGSVCTSARLPDGSLLATSTKPNPMHKGVDQRWAEVWRTDGTHVSVTTSNFLTMAEKGRRELDPAPPRLTTMEQLTAIATTPGLTLYP